MSGKKIVQAATSIAGVAIGIALYQRVPGAAARLNNQTSSSGWISSRSQPSEPEPSFTSAMDRLPLFGANANDFDYHVALHT